MVGKHAGFLESEAVKSRIRGRRARMRRRVAVVRHDVMPAAARRPEPVHRVARGNGYLRGIERVGPPGADQHGVCRFRIGSRDRREAHTRGGAILDRGESHLLSEYGLQRPLGRADAIGVGGIRGWRQAALDGGPDDHDTFDRLVIVGHDHPELLAQGRPRDGHLLIPAQRIGLGDDQLQRSGRLAIVAAAPREHSQGRGEPGRHQCAMHEHTVGDVLPTG